MVMSRCVMILARAVVVTTLMTMTMTWTAFAAPHFQNSSIPTEESNIQISPTPIEPSPVSNHLSSVLSKVSVFTITPSVAVLALTSTSLYRPNSTNNPILKSENSTTAQSTSAKSSNDSELNRDKCGVKADDELGIRRSIKRKVDEENVKLIEYRLKFLNYFVNPLTTDDVKWTYKADTWSRVSSVHGRTIISLAFNYGILSLQTLALNTDVLNVSLKDNPAGCFGKLDESNKIMIITDLLIRDFRPEGAGPSDGGDVTVRPTGEERICSEIIVERPTGYAHLEDWCCYRERSSDERMIPPVNNTKQTICESNQMNGYLRTLYGILAGVRFAVLAFGPLIFVRPLVNFVRPEHPYRVQLKTKRERGKDGDKRSSRHDQEMSTLMVIRAGDNLPDNIIPKSEIQLVRRSEDSFRFTKINSYVVGGEVMTGEPFKAKIKRYDILVNHGLLATESEVDVGLWSVVSKAIFGCRLRHVEPFATCCSANVNGVRRDSGLCKGMTWITIWSRVGHVLAVLLIPTPYYIRLVVLYLLEYDDLMTRKRAAQRLDLTEEPDTNFLHFLLPTHPVFIISYLLYFLAAAVFVAVSRGPSHIRDPATASTAIKKQQPPPTPAVAALSSTRRSLIIVWLAMMRPILARAIIDLEQFSWSLVLVRIAATIVWPFQKFGLLGLCVAIVYLPFAVPLTAIICISYSLPTIYLVVRLFVHSWKQFIAPDNFRPDAHGDLGGGGGTGVRLDRSMDMLDVGNLFRNIKTHCCQSSLNFIKHRKFSTWRDATRAITGCAITWIIFTATLAAGLLVLAECIGFAVEVIVFTLMGIIVNSTELLKYVALLLLMLVYCYDSFKNVNKKYLKLNKALFSDVMRRTGYSDNKSMLLGKHNRGYTTTSSRRSKVRIDTIRGHANGDSLVLFIHKDTLTPRIPRLLFDLACQIRVPGVPGPVYRGLLLALRKFISLGIFIFLVFLIVFSFGSAHDISPTNQTIAALAGGSLPLIFRTLMKPSSPDVEIGTVSFQLQMDDVIHKFEQCWPICDLSLKLAKLRQNDSATVGGPIRETGSTGASADVIDGGGEYVMSSSSNEGDSDDSNKHDNKSAEKKSKGCDTALVLTPWRLTPIDYNSEHYSDSETKPLKNPNIEIAPASADIDVVDCGYPTMVNGGIGKLSDARNHDMPTIVFTKPSVSEDPFDQLDSRRCSPGSETFKTDDNPNLFFVGESQRHESDSNHNGGRLARKNRPPSLFLADSNEDKVDAGTDKKYKNDGDRDTVYNNESDKKEGGKSGLEETKKNNNVTEIDLVIYLPEILTSLEFPSDQRRTKRGKAKSRGSLPSLGLQIM